jgi:hypothetical protein
MHIKYWPNAILILLIFGCGNEKEESDSLSTISLWEDATAIYLPVTEEWTNRVEVADINGDGWVDLLFANGGNYDEPGAAEPLRVFLNSRDSSTFREITNNIFGDQKFLARVVKVRDVNNDTLPDIFIGATFQTQSQLFLNSGNGNFQQVTDSHLPALLSSVGDIEFGDADNDGDLDILLADWGHGNNMENEGGRTMLWLNDGSGQFSDATSERMPEIKIKFSWDVEFLDVDNDFDLDIAVSCKRCGGGRIYLNNGNGYYENKRLLPTYTNNYEFEPMDVNNDGFMDLVTVNDGEIVGGKSWSRREHLFLNDSGKRFIDVTEEYWPDEHNIGEDDNNIVFLDYDSDGDPDFLLSSLSGEDRLLRNDGRGKMELLQPVISGKSTPYTLSLVLADINKDNRLDIVMGQGEGKDALEERIFLGKNIFKDTAPPKIEGIRSSFDSVAQVFTIHARIHDNKSPNMPQDWQKVYFEGDNGEQIPLTWYGENLWRAQIPGSTSGKVCAVDAAGNERCRDVN